MGSDCQVVRTVLLLQILAEISGSVRVSRHMNTILRHPILLPPQGCFTIKNS